MTTFEQALATRGSLVAAWDFEDDDRTRLALYSVGDGGASFVAETQVPRDAHEDMVDRLVERGVRVGAMYAGTPFVWVADEQGFAVWSDTARTAGAKEPSPKVVSVHVFYDGGDRGHRGVRFELNNGGHELIVEEHSNAAKLLTYGQDDFYYETLWAHYLSLHLALWHLVPVVNDIAPRSIDDSLRVARTARELAADIERMPVVGTFPEIVRSMGAIGRASQLAFRFAANPLEPAKRFLELRVTSPSGQTTSGRWIKQGTNAQIAGFLRRVTAPSAALSAMNDLLNLQQQDGYA